ncbi:carbohydrate esterase family 4 protein [Sphaerobolus stellatus SS14]|uniref:Carbohydrate esterase family 4 protein n=1 Tax=Sphaerobolus stellatus (strain SS14) TaxID=990650 RepID=A0A0C9VUE6_SPHS4|nr:carbohydrate esterase family 4 protein [Sphaerobolus stellatus SS14]
MRPPYANYNDQVRSAAYFRNQSRDSSGTSVTAQQAAYTNVANAHPNSILVLNRETYAMTL